MRDHGYVYELLRKLGLSEFGADTGEFLLLKPLRIVAVLLAAAVAARLGERASRRLLRSVRQRAPLLARSPRAERRADTVGEAFASLWRGAVWGVAFLVVLDEVGVNLAPLLTGAGIAGLAVGFGAQSLVRDVLSGFFVLIEDQYGVGDTVTVGDTTGTVEDVSLRTTRLRAVDGTVWFVPNGDIRKVGNASLEWSRALVDVDVAASADVERVRQVVAEEAAAVASDHRWCSAVLEEPEVWGAQAMTADVTTVRLAVKAAPHDQPGLTRELRGRIAARLREEGLRGAA